ncbi:hypothetical protein [Planctomicrobium piriforme]|uniref:Uncharacterized protein n=1 Tax=Planctomicrobium piriforme TaxID=1576369 RepID=A0A1I3SSZ5_9PLAN|nr:hypothetical protein [Planctomicrobium piriforme]SFJ61352.1 hypothetical protein SAMN05421753_12553 [Planctomicrobium piriforme]
MHTRLIALTVCLLACGVWSWGAEKNPGKNPVGGSENEQATLDFVNAHHAELGKLLAKLKKNQQPQYADALKELSRTRERLERMQQKQPERYELELAIWKLDSTIRLVVAQSVTRPDDHDRERLVSLIEERDALRLQLLQFDQVRLQERLKRIQEQIDKQQSGDGAVAAASEADRLTAEVRTKSRTMKTAVKRQRPADQQDEPAEKTAPQKSDEPGK